MNQDYQIEYGTNGIPKFFEFYLFVNPLGQTCYQCEEELNKLIDLIAAKVDIRIICYHNQDLVSRFLDQLKIPQSDLTSRNHIYRSLYLASMAYKAATLQGKRKGRLFLMEMQRRIKGQIEKFSDDFVMDLAEEIGLDMPIFVEDLHSQDAKAALFKDQKIARDMNVVSTPALVIFENYLGKRGTLLEGPFTVNNIIHHLDTMVADDYFDYISEKAMSYLRCLESKKLHSQNS